jgi:hypothetical protein
MVDVFPVDWMDALLTLDILLTVTEQHTGAIHHYGDDQGWHHAAFEELHPSNRERQGAFVSLNAALAC